MKSRHLTEVSLQPLGEETNVTTVKWWSVFRSRRAELIQIPS